MITIPQQINADLNTSYTSTPVTVTQLASSTVSVDNGTIVVNGVDTLTNTASVSSTDQVSIALTSSSTHITPTFSVLTVDGVPEGVFEVITKDAVDEVYDPKYASLSPLLDTTALLDSTAHLYAPDQSKTLTVLDANTSVVVNAIDLNVIYDGVTPAGYNPLDVIDYSFVVDYYSDSILRIDVSSGLVVESISVGSKPYSIGSSLGPGGRSVIFVTNSADNTVSVLDINTYQEDFTIQVGLHPTYIINDINNDMWVVNSHDTFLTKIITDPLNVAGYTLENIPLGYNPTDITASDAYIFVTCIDDDLVLRISLLDNSILEIPVGRSPLGISTDVVSSVYVANSFDGTVSVIDIASGSIIDTVYVGKYPAYVLADLSGWWVVDLHANTVNKYLPQSNQLDSTVTVPAQPLGLDFGPSGQVCVASMYQNLSSRFTTRDSLVKDFSFTPAVNVPTSSVVVSDPYLILDITYDVPVVINPLSDPSTTLVKNGVDVGTSTTVAVGDLLQISITSLNGYTETNSATITIGSSVESFFVTTLEVDDIPDFFEFFPANASQPNTPVVSNEVTIAGLSPNFSLPISISEGTLILNGVDVGNTASIATGDTLSISVQSSAQYCGVVESYLDSPTFDSNFIVSTVQSPDDVVLNDALKDEHPIDVQATAYVPQSVGNIVIIDTASNGVTVQPNYYTLPDLSVPNASTLNNGLSYDFVPLLYDNEVLRIDKSSNDVVHTIPINRPYSVASLQLNAGSPIVVSQPVDNQLSVIDPAQFTVSYTVAVQSPTVVRENPASPEFLVLHFNNTSIARVQVDVVTGQYVQVAAFNLSGTAVDFIVLNNKVYCTILASNIIEVIDLDTLTSSQITLGAASPWSIANNSTDIFVTCGYNSELVRIDITTDTVVSSVSLPEVLPLSLSVTNSSVFIGYLESNTLSTLDIATGSITSVALMDSGVPTAGMYFAQNQGANIVCVSAYGDLGPSRLVPSVHTPSISTFDFPTTLTSQEFTRTYSTPVLVQGLTRPTSIRVGDVFQPELIINDVVQPTLEATISNGDYVTLSAVSPVAGSAGMQIPAMVCSAAYTWTVNSQPDYTPAPFAFVPKVEAFASTQYESSTITIAGVTEDLATPIMATVTPATLVRVNGVILTEPDAYGNVPLSDVDIDPGVSFSFPVHLGDTVSIIGDSGVYDSTRTYTLDIEGVSADYNISTFSILNGIKRVVNNLGGRGKILQLPYSPDYSNDGLYSVPKNLYASTDTEPADKYIPVSAVPTVMPVSKLSVLGALPLLHSPHVEQTPVLLSPTIYKETVIASPVLLSPTIYKETVITSNVLLSPTLPIDSSVGIQIILFPTRNNILGIGSELRSFIDVHKITIGVPVTTTPIHATTNKHYADVVTSPTLPSLGPYHVNITSRVELNRANYMVGFLRGPEPRPDREFRLTGISFDTRGTNTKVGADWLFDVYKHTFQRAPKITKERRPVAFRLADTIPFIRGHVLHTEYFTRDFSRYYMPFRQANLVDRIMYERNYNLIPTSVDSNSYPTLRDVPSSVPCYKGLNSFTINANGFEYTTIGTSHNNNVAGYFKGNIAPRTVIPNPALILRVNRYSIASNIFYKKRSGIKSPSDGRTANIYASQWDIFDYPLFTCSDYGYFGSAQLAIDDSFLQIGLDPSAAQTYEIVPGCYVWAQYIAQPSLCVGTSLFTRIAGWIKGG